MFLNILKYELNYRRKMVSNHIYFAVFLLISFLATIAAGGSFQGVRVGVGGVGSDKIMVNSPFQIHMMIAALSFLGILVVAAMAAKTILRDLENGSYQWFYSLPVSKSAYIFGRFTGTVITGLYAFSSIGIGLWLGSLMPFVEADRFGANHLSAYLYPYLITVLPYLIFSLALFIAMSLYFRTTLALMITAVLIIMGYSVLAGLSVDLKDEFYKALLDPIGLINIGYHTQYWSVSDKNSMLIPCNGVYLYNRLIYGGLGIAILLLTFFKFKFSYFLSAGKPGKAQKDSTEIHKFIVPEPVVNFSFHQEIKNCISMTWQNFRGITRSGAFIVISFFWLLQTAINAQYLGNMFETTIHPITAKVLSVYTTELFLFALALLTIYSGEIVFREKERKFDGIYNSLPVPTWSIMLSRIGALLILNIGFMLAILVVGVVVQMTKGYTNFEMLLYLKYLFGFNIWGYLSITILAFTLQVVLNNKYIGYLAMTGYYLSTMFMSMLDFNHVLYNFNAGDFSYSDLNGFGYFQPFFILKSYWLLFCGLLLFGAYLFWVRGNETALKQRIKIARERMSAKIKVGMSLTLTAFILLGGFIFYNTNILHDFDTNKTALQKKADFEKKYKKLARVEQPRIVDLKLTVDLFPAQRKAVSKGLMVLKNISSQKIDTLILSFNQESVYSFNLNKAYNKLFDDQENGFSAYKLASPLLPEDSITLEFSTEFTGKGFDNNGGSKGITRLNGTFVNNMEILPTLGYSSGYEIDENSDRKQYGLPEKERMNDTADSFNRARSYLPAVYWSNYEATISTEGDQTALTSGELIKKWQQNGRNYFQYKLAKPSLSFFNINSARYLEKKDKWQDIDLAVYYDAKHPYNVSRMIDAMKKSLTYFTANFGAYPHKTLRIVEFPQGNFAQSFPTTIPFSENLGFIANLDAKKENGVDYMLNITAHEIAHQWWAHQLISANVKGATVLTEVLAQYSCLMVLAKNSKEAEVRTFLKHSLDSYLRARGSENEKESPLSQGENQGYLNYDKGVVVMNAIKDYIGEDKVNLALRNLLVDKGYATKIFPVAKSLTDHLLAVAPDSLKYLITDSFDKMVFYDNKIVTATTSKLNTGKYLTKITVDCKKLSADGLGKETTSKLNDYLEVGLLDKNGNPLYLKLHKFTGNKAALEIQTDSQPVKAGIDPFVKLIDKNSDDNLMDIKETGKM